MTIYLVCIVVSCRAKHQFMLTPSVMRDVTEQGWHWRSGLCDDRNVGLSIHALCPKHAKAKRKR